MNDRKLFHYQESAFQELLRTAEAFFEPRWHDFSVKPRFSRLVVGPSGAGKTHIVRALAKHLGIPLFSIDVSNWVLLCASGAERNGETWHHICNFVSKNDKGIIFLDELDKLGRSGDRADSAWNQHLRVELYSLLDGRIPAGLSLAKLEDENDLNDSDQRVCRALNLNPKDLEDKVARLDVQLQPGLDIAGVKRFVLDLAAKSSKVSTADKLATRLQRNMFMIGAGAFQALWEDLSKPRIGMAPSQDGASTELRHRDLQTVIPAELTNRFSATTVILEPLRRKDYQHMLYRTACRLPKDVAGHLVRNGRKEMDQAIESGLGVRWVESLLLRSLAQLNAPTKGALAPANLACS